MQQFQVRRSNFSEHRLADASSAALSNGQVQVRIKRFAYTANNVTYAAAGDTLGYWQFFPPADDANGTWGMTPVWGFAEVIQSKHAEVPVGERLFGYWPPAQVWVLQPERVSEQRLFDGAPHRAKLPPTYNAYNRVAAEPGYDPAMDVYRMLLWPLYVTSFCLCDALADAEYHGAEQVLILSASSKTSIGLAQGLAAEDGSPAVVGVTSARNVQFVSDLGVYDQVVSYDAVDGLDATKATVIVDMSGNSALLDGLMTQFGDALKQCVLVGMTHWDAAGGQGVAADPRSHFFFAPGHIQKRVADWGADGFASRSQDFLTAGVKQSASWLQLTAVQGLEALAAKYPDICAGTVPPEQGLIVTP